MDSRNMLGLGLTLVVLGTAGGFLAMAYSPGPSGPEGAKGETPTRVQIRAPAWKPAFAPPAPDTAPGALGERAARGHRIMMSTQEHAKAHVGNALSCRNCHFGAGRERDTISLVGVAAQYPRPGAGGTLVTLADKVRECFRTNLAGEPPAADSAVLEAVTSYLTWLSAGMPIYRAAPWLGLEPLEEAGEAAAGMKRFSSVCSSCHGATGQGTGIAPPLVGPGSFTTASAMAEQPMLAAFVHRFMPLDEPKLSEREAADVAAFLLTQPRAAAPPSK